MSEDKTIHLTYCYGNQPQDILGWVNLTTNSIWDIFKEHPELFTFEPSYMINEDGKAELIEISLIPKRSPKASMALNDIIDDLS